MEEGNAKRKKWRSGKEEMKEIEKKRKNKGEGKVEKEKRNEMKK